MRNTLKRVPQLPRENLDVIFMSIVHLIIRELLKECHKKWTRRNRFESIEPQREIMEQIWTVI